MRLLRVRGSTSQAGLAPATTASSTSGTSSSTNNSSGSTNTSTNTTGSLSGEGEGQGDEEVANAADLSDVVRPQSSSLRLASSQGSATNDNSTIQQLSPSQAIRQLLGSARHTAESEVSLSKADAVDAAMESVLPALELKLADDLQDALASGGQLSAAATDEIVAGL